MSSLDYVLVRDVVVTSDYSGAADVQGRAGAGNERLFNPAVSKPSSFCSNFPLYSASQILNAGRKF
jgi:hypothetical protein